MAGLITFITSSALAARKSKSSADTESTSALWRRSRRNSSPSRVPPGSRRRSASIPACRSRSLSKLAWVLLPEPSPPSKVIKTPRLGVEPEATLLVVFGGEKGVGGAGFEGKDADAALGLPAATARAQVKALGELV